MKKKAIHWSDEEISHFCRQLGELLQSGMPMLASLDVIANQSKKLSVACRRIKQAVQSGKALSESLRVVQFPEESISFIEAAEEHGDYAWGCMQSAEVYEQKVRFYQEVKKAVRYPLVVLLVILIALFFLHRLVIPRFQDLYLSLGVSLPWMTRAAIPLTLYCCILFSLSLFAVLFMVYGKQLWMKIDAVIRLFLSLPVIGTILSMRYGHYFALHLGAFLQAGLPLNRALSVLEKLTPWKPIQNNISAIRQGLMEGKSLTDSMFNLPYPFFEPMMRSMLQVSERTGEIGKGFFQYAEITERRLQRYLEQCFQRAEPILILSLGVLVGIMVFSLFLPMFQLVEAI